MPTYPREAWANLVQGDVTVEFDITDTGVVQNIKVTASNDSSLTNATLEAISRFRYAPAMESGKAIGSQGIKEKFSFRIMDGTDPVVTSAAL